MDQISLAVVVVAGLLALRLWSSKSDLAKFAALLVGAGAALRFGYDIGVFPVF